MREADTDGTEGVAGGGASATRPAPPTRYVWTAGRIGFGIAALVGMALIVDGFVHGSPLEAATLAAWLLAVLTVLYAVFWRPAVVVDDTAVTLINPVRTVRVPWGALREIDTRFALTLITDDARYQSWAAVAPGRPPGTFSPSRRAKVHDLRMPPTISGEAPDAQAASRRLDGGAGATAFVVELAWAQWRDRQARAGSRDGVTEASGVPGDGDHVQVSGEPVVIIVFVVAVGMGVLGAAVA